METFLYFSPSCTGPYTGLWYELTSLGRLKLTDKPCTAKRVPVWRLSCMPVWKQHPASSAAMWVLEKSRQGVLTLLPGGYNRNVSAASDGQHCPSAAISPHAPCAGACSVLLGCSFPVVQVSRKKSGELDKRYIGTETSKIILRCEHNLEMITQGNGPRFPPMLRLLSLPSSSALLLM